MRYQDIDVLCLCKKDGTIIPQKIRFEDPQQQEVIRVKIESCIDEGLIAYSGIKTRKFKCIGVTGNRQVHIQLYYELESCIWKLVSVGP